MSMHCEEVRVSLGVYVVGAIDPAERSMVDSHLGGCRGCRDDLAGLAGLPALLGRVNEGQIAQLAAPPEELLDSLLARAAEERTRTRRGLRGAARWAPLAAAAAVLLFAGVMIGGQLVGDSSGSPRTLPTSSSPSRSTRPPPEMFTASNAGTGVSAELAVHNTPMGVYAKMHLKGVEQGTRCRLDAVTWDGRRDSMGSWTVPSKEYTGFHGYSMYPRSEVTSFKIVRMDGRVLLSIPAT